MFTSTEITKRSTHRELVGFRNRLLLVLVTAVLAACGGGGGSDGVGPQPPIDPDLSQVTCNPSSLLANGADTATITVTVVDVNGDVVPNQIVQLSVSGTGNIFSPDPPEQPSDANGVAVFTLASTTVETKTISAIVNPGAGDIMITEQCQVDFVSGDIDPNTSSVVASPDTVVADGVAVSVGAGGAAVSVGAGGAVVSVALGRRARNPAT